MGLIQSGWLFLLGILRRWYLAAPAILIGFPEINRDILSQMLPASWQADITWQPTGIALVGYIVLWLAAVMTFHEERLKSPQLLRPDWTLKELLDWALPEDDRIDSASVTAYLSAMARLQNDIRQKAVLGIITVWGIPVGSGQGFTPLTPIQAIGWEHMQIDLTAPPPGRTEGTTLGRDPVLYRNLTFSKKQIRREIKRERGWTNLVRKLRDLL